MDFRSSLPSALTGRRRLTTFLILAVATLTPTALLLDPSTSFSGGDWVPHIFTISYLGEYFRQHFALPVTMSTDVIVGAPNNVLYATLFYPVAGVLSALLGANLAVRLLLIGAIALQTWQVYAAARVLSTNRWLAYSVVFAVDASIYSLTDLYDRSDLTEFVGLALLTAAVSAWLRWSFAPTDSGWAVVLQAGLFLGCAVTSNPIIVLLGNALAALVVLLTLVLRSGRLRVLFAAFVVVAIELVLVGPWLYTYARTQAFESPGLLFTGPAAYVPGVDDLRVRFLPYPFDARGRAASTPHLDAQISIALVVLLALLLYESLRSRKWSGPLRVAPVCALLALSVALYSASPLLGDRVRVLALIQSEYRLVPYVDLLLLISSFLLLVHLGRTVDLPLRRSALLFAVVLAVSTQTVLLKEFRSNVQDGITAASGFHDNRDSLASAWETATNFGVPVGPVARADQSDMQHVALHVGIGSQFGVPQTATVDAAVGTLVATNVQSFPWTHLVIDGQVVPDSEITVVDDPGLGFLLGFVASRGGLQTVGVQINPGAVWQVLMVLSFLGVAALTAGLLAWTALGLSGGCPESGRRGPRPVR